MEQKKQRESHVDCRELISISPAWEWDF